MRIPLGEHLWLIANKLLEIQCPGVYTWGKVCDFLMEHKREGLFPMYDLTIHYFYYHAGDICPPKLEFDEINYTLQSKQFINFALNINRGILDEENFLPALRMFLTGVYYPRFLLSHNAIFKGIPVVIDIPDHCPRCAESMMVLKSGPSGLFVSCHEGCLTKFSLKSFVKFREAR